MLALKEHDGREIQSVEFPDGEILPAGTPNKYFYAYDYRGDHALEWIVVVGPDGVEKQRVNLMDVSSWVWMPPVISVPVSDRKCGTCSHWHGNRIMADEGSCWRTGDNSRGDFLACIAYQSQEDAAIQAVRDELAELRGEVGRAILYADNGNGDLGYNILRQALAVWR